MTRQRVEEILVCQQITELARNERDELRGSLRHLCNERFTAVHEREYVLQVVMVEVALSAAREGLELVAQKCGASRKRIAASPSPATAGRSIAVSYQTLLNPRTDGSTGITSTRTPLTFHRQRGEPASWTCENPSARSRDSSA